MPDFISQMADAPSFRIVPPSTKLTPDQILERSKMPDGTNMFLPGGSLIPAARNFASIINSGSRVFSYRFDEAQRDSWVQARAMKRDAFILGLLEERVLPTVNRTHQLQVDNERDPDQKAVRDGLEKLVRAIPDFDAFKTAQMEAVWFGRAGCSWGFQRNEDLMYQWGIPKWTPVHGDSIQFTFEQVPAILMDSMTASWYVSNGATQGPQGDIRSTDRGGQALALHRPFWRDRYSIHVHRRQMADFFEGELAGSMQGIGLRGMVYWAYVVRTDALTWMLAYMQAVGQMDLLVFNYPAGNAEAKLNQEANAQKIIGKAAIACPRNPTGNWPAIEQIQMNSAGLKALHDLVADYFDRHIERLIVGQSMSSGADHGDGLGGTGRAMFAKATKDEILVYDTNRLDATLTNDLIGPLKKYNYGKAKFGVRFKSILPNLEAEGKVDNGMKLIQAGIAIKQDEMRESAGFSRPEEGDEVIGGQPSPEEMMQQMMMAQGGQPPSGPGMPPGGPNGGPPGGMPPGPPSGPAAVFSGGNAGMAHQLPPGAPVPASRYAHSSVAYSDDVFLSALENDPEEGTTHGGYADWLDENGYSDEAQFHRALMNPDVLAALKNNKMTGTRITEDWTDPDTKDLLDKIRNIKKRSMGDRRWVILRKIMKPEWFHKKPPIQAFRYVGTRKPVRYAELSEYPEHQQLLQAIHENPLEATTHLAHADWLDENGFPDEAGFRRSMGDWVGKKWMKNPALSIHNPRRFGESMPWTVYPTKGRIPDEIDNLEIPSVPGLSHVRRETPSYFGVPLLPNSTHLFWKSYPDMEEAMRHAYHRTKKYRAERGIPPKGNPGRYSERVTPTRYAKLEDHPEHQQLLAAIHANPLEATTHHAHADWLEENGFSDESAFRRSMAGWVKDNRMIEPYTYSSYPYRVTVGNYPEGVWQEHLPLFWRRGENAPEEIQKDRPLLAAGTLNWKTYPNMENAFRHSFHKGLQERRSEEQAQQSQNDSPTQFAEGGGVPPAAGPTMGSPNQYYPGGGNTYIPKMGRLGKSIKKDVGKTTRYSGTAPTLYTEKITPESVAAAADVVISALSASVVPEIKPPVTPSTPVRREEIQIHYGKDGKPTGATKTIRETP